ncbi:MAG: c-type cytochrome, partial [Burkholderiales bacterium]
MTRLIKASAIVLAVALAAVLPGQNLAGQTAATKDDYQRSANIYGMRTSARSGPQRGEEIYYYKCWYCHNRYAKTGPPLKDLFTRALPSGQPRSDREVAEKIRQGGPIMPAYRHVLTEADLADLLSYLKDARCCFEGNEPPPNPRYRGVAASSVTQAPARRSVLGGARG